MAIADIVSSVFAGLALLVSGLTAYLTLLSRFKAAVLPKRRAILLQIDNVPHLVLEYEFLNLGSKPGLIDDIILGIAPDTGSDIEYAPHLVCSPFSMFRKISISRFSAFSGISLGSKERRELYIAFKSNLQSFQFPPGKAAVRTSIRVGTRKEWMTSPCIFSLELTKDILDKWTGYDYEPQQIEAIEIGESRRWYRLKRQKG